MADIFGNTQPPQWLQRIAQPIDSSITGKVIGDLVGGLADATEIAIKSATDKQAKGINTSWIKELPGSIKPGLAEARLNVQNPLWKMQAQQAQLNMAQQALGIKSQQSLIEARTTKLRMQEHDQDVLPKWLQEHPTWESRQDAEPPQLFTSEAQKMYRDVQLGDAGNIKHKAIVEGIDAYSKAVAKLPAKMAGPFAAQIGKVPTPEMWVQLNDALAKAEVGDLAPKPFSFDVDGKTITGVYNPKTGHFSQTKPDSGDSLKKEAVKDDLKDAYKELDEARKAFDAARKTKDKDAARLKVSSAESRIKAITSKLSPQAAPATKKVLTYDPATDTLK